MPLVTSRSTKSGHPISYQLQRLCGRQKNDRKMARGIIFLALRDQLRNQNTTLAHSYSLAEGMEIEPISAQANRQQLFSSYERTGQAITELTFHRLELDHALCLLGSCKDLQTESICSLPMHVVGTHFLFNLSSLKATLL